MAIPENRLSTTPVIGDIIQPLSRNLYLKKAYHPGGIAIGNPGQGLRIQTWVAEVIGRQIVVRGETTGESRVFITESYPISEVSLAFDQNMQPVLAYVVRNECKLFWYDTQIQDYVITSYGSAKNPRVVVDDTRPLAVLKGVTDVLFFYQKGSALVHRRQRDRYSQEILLAESVKGNLRRVGMTEKYRLQLDFGY